MASNVGALTARRKENLRESGRAQNSMTHSGLKPAGPRFAGYDNNGDFVGSPTEAWISLLGGAALTTYGVLELVNRKPKLLSSILTVLGGGLLFRGVTGLLNPTDDMTESDVDMENEGAVIGHLEGIKIDESIVIDRPHDQLYAFWRDFSNLPRFMHNLESVQAIDDNRSHWVAKGPMGTKVEWDAEIYIEKVGEMISWRSTEDSEIQTAGSVHFLEEAPGRTRVAVDMKIDPPAGVLGITVARIFGEDPSSEIKQDLKRFKELMELHRPEYPETSGRANGTI